MKHAALSIGVILLAAGWYGQSQYGQALAQSAPSSAASIYTCVDAHGRRITADRPIAECLDREQRELSPSGAVRRQIAPSYTEQERAALEAKRLKEAEELSRAAEEKRRDRALVARYPDQAAHDAGRREAVAQVEDVIAAAKKRITEVQKQRKTLDAEMEFYKKDPSKAPAKLRYQLTENEGLLQGQQRFIAQQEQEKVRIHQRFDAELAQLQKLWAAQRANAPGTATAPQTGR